jgi:hypothetical protein
MRGDGIFDSDGNSKGSSSPRGLRVLDATQRARAYLSVEPWLTDEDDDRKCLMAIARM